MAVSNLSQWQADVLRLTVFTTDPLAVSMLDWWKSVTGSEPESRTSKMTIGLHTAEGPFEHAKLLLNIAPGRIDWLLTPIPSSDDPTPTVGSYTEAEQLFSKLLGSWLKGIPVSVIRLAYGANVRVLVGDKASGYKLLGELIPSLKIDPEGSSDLQYQINRPRSSKVLDGLRINRLSKWSVIHFALVESISRVKGVGSEQFCSIQLDINTDPAFKPKLDSPVVVRELMDLGSEIITRGDVL